MNQELLNFLRNNTWSSFYNSLLSQYNSKGYLSPKQLESVQRAMLKQLEPKPPTMPKTYSIAPGVRIEVKAWIARRLKVDTGLAFFFRNIEVVDVLNETAKAYQLKVKFVSQIVTSCHICGRDLDTDVSRATGIGPVCADRMGLPRPTLATAHETLKAIDALCQGIGAVGPIWVPKSQIKTGNV